MLHGVHIFNAYLWYWRVLSSNLVNSIEDPFVSNASDVLEFICSYGRQGAVENTFWIYIELGAVQTALGLSNQAASSEEQPGDVDIGVSWFLIDLWAEYVVVGLRLWFFFVW